MDIPHDNEASRRPFADVYPEVGDGPLSPAAPSAPTPSGYEETFTRPALTGRPAVEMRQAAGAPEPGRPASGEPPAPEGPPAEEGPVEPEDRRDEPDQLQREIDNVREEAEALLRRLDAGGGDDDGPNDPPTIPGGDDSRPFGVPRQRAEPTGPAAWQVAGEAERLLREAFDDVEGAAPSAEPAAVPVADAETSDAAATAETPDRPSPPDRTLAPGSALHYSPDRDLDPQAGGEPAFEALEDAFGRWQVPERAYVALGGGERGEGQADPTLLARIGAGKLVAVHAPNSQQALLVNIGSDPGEGFGRAMIAHGVGNVPEFAEPGTTGYVLGSVEYADVPPDVSDAWNRDLQSFLTDELGIAVPDEHVITAGAMRAVTLNASTGQLLVRNPRGDVIWPPDYTG